MKTLKLAAAIAFIFISFSALEAQDGEQLFKSNCASCHKLGERLVGPDLIGVNERRDEKWLVKWIKSSQTMVKEGDPVAVQLYNDYNKIPMTDAFINEDEIKSVLAYIKTQGTQMASSGGVQAAAPGTSAVVSPGPVASAEPGVNLLNMFSFGEYLLMGLLCLFLIVIWILSRSIKALTSQLQEKYNGQ